LPSRAAVTPFPAAAAQFAKELEAYRNLPMYGGKTAGK